MSSYTIFWYIQCKTLRILRVTRYKCHAVELNDKTGGTKSYTILEYVRQNRLNIRTRKTLFSSRHP